jgi:hypothetical protein
MTTETLLKLDKRPQHGLAYAREATRNLGHFRADKIIQKHGTYGQAAPLSSLYPSKTGRLRNP